MGNTQNNDKTGDPQSQRPPPTQASSSTQLEVTNGPMELDEPDLIEYAMDDMPFRIQDGLFLGSAMAESNLPKLKQKGITHILTVAEGYPCSHPSHFTYKQIQVQDECSVDLMVHCGGPQGAFAFIDGAIASGGACLVHCMAGVSRSATVVIGWLMQKHRMSFDEAFRRVHAVRPWICPNPGFRLQLERFAALEYDLSKWSAWRHSFQEEPGAVVNLAGLISRPL